MVPTVGVVIGVAQCQDHHYPPLPAAQSDAIHFARALTHWGVTETTLLLNESATLGQLQGAFEALAKRTTDYKLVFYFCGHGTRESHPLSSSYLRFFDGQIHLDALIHTICQSRAIESYVFIDACSLRINSLLNPKLEEETRGYKISHKSLFCLLSSGIQESFENGLYGYFTDALLKTLATTRKMEPDSSQFFGQICQILQEKDLPLPEMYNIGNQKISFLPPLHPFFQDTGLLYRSEMIGKMEDAFILNRGKIGTLLGEVGSGKTSLCQCLAHDSYKTFYVTIPSLPSPYLDLVSLLPPSFASNGSYETTFAGSRFFIDRAELLLPEQLDAFVEQFKNSSVQFLLISNQSLKGQSSSCQNSLFEIPIDPLSPEEGKLFGLPFSHTETETRLIHLAAKGNPSKMRHLAHCLKPDASVSNKIEKNEIIKALSAVYGCGSYVDKNLFIQTFQLSPSSLALFEDLGLIYHDQNAWVLHPLIEEMAESESLTLDREKILEYWYQQMKQSPHLPWAAKELIFSVRCLGYEKKGDPYLKIAFQTLLQGGKDHTTLFIEAAQIFQSIPKMTAASSLLTQILINCKQFDVAHRLEQAKPLRQSGSKILLMSCLSIGLVGLLVLFSPLFQKNSSQSVHLKRIHPDFVGRSSYLIELKKRCMQWDNTTPPVTVLWGESGIGKSEIAIAFANVYAKHFQWIFWIDCETEESYAASYHDVAGQLKIPCDFRENAVEKVHRYLEEEKAAEPWLLIFDNLTGKVALPSKGKGSILITTRNRAPWSAHECMEVGPFQEQEALDLMKKITKGQASKEACLLVHELECLPFMLNLAAHYIAETPEMNEALYLKLLSQNQVGLLSTMLADTHYPTTLLSSWNMTAAELSKHNPKELLWLHFCSFLHPSGIPASWVEKWLIEIEKETDSFQIKVLSSDILRNLVNHCLMRFEKSNHTLSLHNLKQGIMQQDLYFQKEMVDQVATFLIRCAEHVEQIAKGKIAIPLGDLREWELHAAWFLNKYSSACSKEKIASLQNLLGNWKYLKGDYKVAQSYLEQSLAKHLELFGENHAHTMIVMNNLALILWENGRLEESKQLFARSLEVSKTLYNNDDHLDVILTLHNLGWLSWEMGQFEEARAILNQSFDSSQKLKVCDPDYLQGVNEFFRSLEEEEKKGHVSDREKQITKALFLRSAGLWIAEVEGHPAKSLGYFEECLEILKKILPEEDPRVAIAYGSVGISLNRAERSEEGQSYLSKALEIQRKMLGENHPETAKSYANLAISFYNLGKYKQALEYHLKGLEIRQKTLGEEHPVTAKSYSGVGKTLVALRKFEEACRYNQKALEIRQKTLGEEHSETAQSYSRLGINFSKLGRHEEAIHYNLKALEILQKKFGNEHFLIEKVHEALAACYKDCGDPVAAQDHARRAAEIKKHF